MISGPEEREVLQQALDALEKSAPVNAGRGWIRKHSGAKHAIRALLSSQTKEAAAGNSLTAITDALDYHQLSGDCVSRIEQLVKIAESCGWGTKEAAVPAVCDGKEQDAFEAWAKSERMSLETHPMHWLFLDTKTNAARKGWKGALSYVNTVLAAAPQQPSPAVPAEGVRTDTQRLDWLAERVVKVREHIDYEMDVAKTIPATGSAEPEGPQK